MAFFLVVFATTDRSPDTSLARQIRRAALRAEAEASRERVDGLTGVAVTRWRSGGCKKMQEVKVT